MRRALPITIARMGSAYGDRGGLPLWHLQALAAGQPVVARWDPLPYSPIHYDDIDAQVEALLDAAAVPTTIVNWCGDVPVTVQQWSAHFGELLGVDVDLQLEPVPGASVGSVGDPSTPYPGAVALAATLDNARLLTESGGPGATHTSFFDNACIRAKVIDYLVDTTLPATGTRCAEE